MPEKKDYALETVDLREVEIAAADVTVYGGGSPPEGDTYSIADLELIAEHSNIVADDLRAPVKIGHDKKQRLLRASGLWGEEPRSGTLKNFKVKGDKLVCDLMAMPKKLADLVPTAFRLRSMELGSARSQRTNESYPTVVKGLALLGATTPAFQTLDDIHAMYAGKERESTSKLLFADSKLEDGDDSIITNFAVGDIVWDDEDGVMDIMNDIREQLNPEAPMGVESWPRYWVMDLQLMDVDGDGDVPGPRALVGEYGNGAAWVVPISFDPSGEPIVPPSTDWTLAEQAWVQSDDTGGGGEDEGDGEYGDKNGGNGAPADTTGIVKVKIGEDTVELPDLDENQVKVFAELYKLEGDDVTAEKVYEAIAAKAAEEAPAPPEHKPDADADKGKTFTEAEFAELRDRAERGDRAFEQMRVDRRDGYFKSLVNTGKLNPADLEFWTKEYDENEGAARRLLEVLPVNEDLLRVYGGDADGLDFSNDDESAYRAYCANQGIPYVKTSRVAA